MFRPFYIFLVFVFLPFITNVLYLSQHKAEQHLGGLQGIIDWIRIEEYGRNRRKFTKKFGVLYIVMYNKCCTKYPLLLKTLIIYHKPN